ncbi:glycosyltransferase family 4 protein [Sphingomonas sp. R86521]|uniref:glycosyltransferase family 4 protein n=1 Tax=Sphingomonas sp. R86521 TaxID=3093860 RepID=UPI0036D2F3F6
MDLSRLLTRVMRPTPTGIDRVELIYAQWLLAHIPERLSFAGRHPMGLYGRLDLPAVRQFLSYLGALWRNGDRIDPRALRTAALKHLAALRPRATPPRKGARVFLQASPQDLDRQDRMAGILSRERAKFVCLVHDLIPITHPEFARPESPAAHIHRMRTVAALADGIIVNSGATRTALLDFLPGDLPESRVRVALLGTEPVMAPDVRTAKVGDKPYFVCVGTIEPRKNHLLLLNVWTRLAERLGTDAPELVLIGRRGWENEQVVDMLERSIKLPRLVHEHGEMSDREMQAVLGGARALLLPSFVEGFGMPVSEALAANVPVICADIPALREVGGAVPDYLDPLDGLGWMRVLIEYAAPVSLRRDAQLERLKDWQMPTWTAHMTTVMELIDEL